MFLALLFLLNVHLIFNRYQELDDPKLTQNEQQQNRHYNCDFFLLLPQASH